MHMQHTAESFCWTKISLKPSLHQRDIQWNKFQPMQYIHLSVCVCVCGGGGGGGGGGGEVKIFR